MKKILSLLVVLAILAGGVVYAQDASTPEQPPELTEEQQAELDQIWQQIRQLQNQALDKMAEFGVISRERAEWIKQGRELNQNEAWGPGFGRFDCHGAVEGSWGRGPGRMHRGFGSFGW